MLKQSLALIGLTLSLSANAALISRLGGQAAYDDVLDITWATDAGLSTSANWASQVAWAEGLNTSNYLGFSSGWRLAYYSAMGGAGPVSQSLSPSYCQTATELECQDNEMAYMYYYNLAAIAGPDKTGTHTIGNVTLSNIQSTYWTGTEAITSGQAYDFMFSNGQQYNVRQGFNLAGWVVRDGDVGVQSLPVPAAAWLFGSALLGLATVKRKKA